MPASPERAAFCESIPGGPGGRIGPCSPWWRQASPSPLRLARPRPRPAPLASTCSNGPTWPSFRTLPPEISGAASSFTSTSRAPRARRRRGAVGIVAAARGSRRRRTPLAEGPRSVPSAAAGHAGYGRRLVVRRRVPMVRQLAHTDCGAACLAMVLAYHGKHVALDELREMTSTNRDGVDALAVTQAARRYGLSARGVAADLDDLKYLPPATILHWDFTHFVVFERLRRNG